MTMNASISPLGAETDARVVGGKAATLALLLKQGFTVPKGFVIGHDGDIADDGLMRAFDALGAVRVAVRSSALGEDGARRSWAGQYASFLDIDRQGLKAAVLACRQSGAAARARAYGTPHAVAVIVQEMIQGTISGVAFTKNPAGAGAYLEAVRGSCAALTDGSATPDAYTVVGSAVTRQGALLDDKAVLRIVAAAKEAEELLKHPVDMEWTIKGKTLYILQARPITA